MIHVDIITPDGTVFQGNVDSISVPTPDGEITILPHHIPLISIVVPGSMLVREGGSERYFSITRGVIEVTGTSVRILADTAERAEEMEEEAIAKAKSAAEDLLRERRHDTEGFAEATAVLERELARLSAVKRLRRRRGQSILPPPPT